MSLVEGYGPHMGHFRRYSIAAVLVVCLVGAAWGQDLSGRYAWPLPGQTQISSGFCDYRGWHYHGGIDVSTGGREGIPIRAADSGWVMRVSTSYWGYGKGLYLKLADGRIAVYGHLSQLAPRIQEYVELNQYAVKRYKQNLWPAPGEIPVKRGEIIGKTGQTGSGPPHLHFELRTAGNRPLNPLRVGFEKPDRHPPGIKAIMLIPQQPDRPGEPLSQVDGQLMAQTYKLKGPANQRTLDITPTLSGIAGVAISTNDVIDNGKWTASTYRCRLWINDVLVAEVRHDSISYDDTRLINLERVFDGKPGYAERPVRLYRSPGNRLWHYASLLNEGWLETGETVMPGTNDVFLEVEDPAGNTSSAAFQIRVWDAADNRHPDPGGGEISTELSRVREIGGVNGTVLATYGTSRPEWFLDRGMTRRLSVARVDDSSWMAWVPAAVMTSDTVWLVHSDTAVPHSLSRQAVTANDGGHVTSEDGRVSIEFDPGDLYESAFFDLAPALIPKKAGKTFSGAYTLSPANIPFARGVSLSIGYDVAGDARRLGLYRYRSSRKSWTFVGAEHSKTKGAISAKIDYPGTFALIADIEPPVIRYVKPGRGARTSKKRPAIRFEMFDELSGIGSDADVTLTIDGVWVPVEYDPDIRKAKARPRDALSVGQHRVEIAVKDRVGNEETFLRLLNIVK